MGVPQAKERFGGQPPSKRCNCKLLLPPGKEKRGAIPPFPKLRWTCFVLANVCIRPVTDLSYPTWPVHFSTRAIPFKQLGFPFIFWPGPPCLACFANFMLTLSTSLHFSKSRPNNQLTQCTRPVRQPPILRKWTILVILNVWKFSNSQCGFASVQPVRHKKMKFLGLAAQPVGRNKPLYMWPTLGTRLSHSDHVQPFDTFYSSYLGQIFKSQKYSRIYVKLLHISQPVE